MRLGPVPGPPGECCPGVDVSVTVYFVDSSVRIWDDKSLEDGKQFAYNVGTSGALKVLLDHGSGPLRPVETFKKDSGWTVDPRSKSLSEVMRERLSEDGEAPPSLRSTERGR